MIHHDVERAWRLVARVFENVAKGETSEVGLTQWFVENTMPPEY